MSRVLVVGHAPLPWEDLERSYGPGTRTWQFASPLAGDGHEVTILASRIPYVYPEGIEAITHENSHGCSIYRVSQDVFEVGGFTDRLFEELDPDCVVGATAYPSYVTSIYAGRRPFWADVFGSLLAEAQAKAAVYWNNHLLEHFMRINLQIIRTADVFSTVSVRQKYELIGHIGAAARLGAETFGYGFAHPIPCGVEETVFPGTSSLPGGCGPDDFIVLWSGGFNTWTDVDTLFAGMEAAMSRSPRVHFISTGGEIKGHDERTYLRFEEMVNGSRFRDRFHLLGWVRRTEALSLYAASSVGISIDAEHYEVAFGSRNRLLEWALAGLPAVSTDLCELTGELAGRGLMFPIPVGDPGALAEVLLELESEGGRLAASSAGLRAFVLERFSFGRTTLPLRAWVEEPSHAPDFEERLPLRMLALEGARKASRPPIMPGSPAGKKLRYYLRSEGVAATMKRGIAFVGRRKSDRSPGVPGEPGD